MRLGYRSSSFSETGPRASNEDAVSSWRNSHGTLIVAIADGLGGMGGGSTASQLAMDTVREYVSDIEVGNTTLSKAVLAAHSAILNHQLVDPMYKNMATTFTVIAFLDKRIVGAHTGDTRAAIARNDGIKKLTIDHSEGQKLFAAGKLTKDELASYPRQHILESALGAQKQPTIDEIDFEIQAGDKLVLTSDGVHGLVFLREMRELLASSDAPEIVAEKLINTVDQRGPKDNFSGAVIFVDPETV